MRCWWSSAQLMCISAHWIKSIEPISIWAEYNSFVVLFSHLRWSLISDDWLLIEESDPVCRSLFHWCVYLFTYLHSCWAPSAFFSSSTARRWSPSGRSSRPLPGRRWRPAASPRPRCCCCPLSPSLCLSAPHLRAAHAPAHESREEQRKTNGVTPIYLLNIWMEM